MQKKAPVYRCSSQGHRQIS